MRGFFVDLRPVKYEDCEQIRIWRNSRDVYYNMYTWEQITPEMQEKWYRERVYNNEKNKYFMVCIKDERPIGLISLNNIDYNNRRTDFAYYIANPADRVPLRSVEAERLILNYAFRNLGLNKVCCEVFVYNKAVVRFHEKFGFDVEGIFRDHAMHDGQLKDVAYLGLLERKYCLVETRIEDLLRKANKQRG